MSNRRTIDHHRDGRSVDRYHTRLRRQRPTEVDRVGAGDRAALCWCIDRTERLGGMYIVDRDRLGSKIGLLAGLVKCDRMELVSSVARRARAAGIRQDVGEQLIAPARA